MATKVSQLSINQFQEIVENAVEQKLLELIGDPDEGLTVRQSVRNRLIRQQKRVKNGDRGVSLQESIKRLGLE